MQQTMMDASLMVVQAITATITQPLGTTPTNQYISALRCLQAWLSFLRAEYVTFPTSYLFFFLFLVILMFNMALPFVGPYIVMS